MVKSTISVLLVDDNLVFRNLAARFLATLPGIEVAGTAEGGADGLLLAATLHPDLILMDLHLRNEHGLQIIPQLRTMLPQVGIIALSLLDPLGFSAATLQAGADAFVDKMTMASDLLPAIQQVSQRSLIASV
ncbi:MAG: response regulator transcription factor [Acidobacteria bacterium]|nr:response regulator transcription factor [Acidobacteriota bacterium]